MPVLKEITLAQAFAKFAIVTEAECNNIVTFTADDSTVCVIWVDDSEFEAHTFDGTQSLIVDDGDSTNFAGINEYGATIWFIGHVAFDWSEYKA